MAKRVVRIDPSKLLDRMRDAEKNGSSEPDTFTIGHLSFSRTNDTIFVADMTNRVFLGSASDGRFRPSKRCTADLVDVIKRILRNPRKAAAAVGTITGTCACCGRFLGPDDVARGIGSTCWKKWGWEKSK